jgi:hypothetical protein
VAIVDAEQRIDGLPVVGQVDLGEARSALADNVEGMYGMVRVAKALDDCASKFSAGSGHSNFHNFPNCGV